MRSCEDDRRSRAGLYFGSNVRSYADCPDLRKPGPKKTFFVSHRTSETVGRTSAEALVDMQFLWYNHIGLNLWRERERERER